MIFSQFSRDVTAEHLRKKPTYCPVTAWQFLEKSKYICTCSSQWSRCTYVHVVTLRMHTVNFINCDLHLIRCWPSYRHPPAQLPTIRYACLVRSHSMLESIELLSLLLFQSTGFGACRRRKWNVSPLTSENARWLHIWIFCVYVFCYVTWSCGLFSKTFMFFMS